MLKFNSLLLLAHTAATARVARLSSISVDIVLPVHSRTTFVTWCGPTQSKHINATDVHAVAERIGVDADTTAGKKEVCASFQNLTKACSSSTFAVRSASFTEGGLDALDKAEREQIKQAACVMGVSLGMFHKGLHIPQNIRDLGMATKTNVAESKHKEVKQFAGSARGRDNLEHIWRTTSDALALKALVDGVTWDARGWDGRQWLHESVSAGPVCREVLQDLFQVLTLSPAFTAGDDVKPNGKRPSGYVEWEADLQNDVGGREQSGWSKVVADTIPNAQTLSSRYSEMLACGRGIGEVACTSPTCSSCWRDRGGGLTHSTVACFNHWGDAPLEVSAGTGTIRGGAVKDAAVNPVTWLLSTASRANDVEIYVTPKAQEDGTRGVRFTTLEKVVYFFEHRGNDLRRGDATHIRQGAWTVWVAVLEYVTAGTGHRRKVDPATGCDVFTLRRTLTFYPASAIRCVVHMVHSCPTSGAFTCGLSSQGRKKAVWRCTPRHGAQYILNKYFHSFGRDPIS